LPEKRLPSSENLLPGSSFRWHGSFPAACARPKSRGERPPGSGTAAMAAFRHEGFGTVRRCRRSRARGRALKWPKRPCERPKSPYQAPSGEKKNSAPLRYQSPPGVLGPGMALGYSRGRCRGCPKTAARQRKTSARQRKTSAWQKFSLPGSVSAGTAGRRGTRRLSLLPVA
jgi:hypothetical protein